MSAWGCAGQPLKDDSRSSVFMDGLISWTAMQFTAICAIDSLFGYGSLRFSVSCLFFVCVSTTIHCFNFCALESNLNKYTCWTADCYLDCFSVGAGTRSFDYPDMTIRRKTIVRHGLGGRPLSDTKKDHWATNSRISGRKTTGRKTVGKE